jgi:hypothetical protein
MLAVTAMPIGRGPARTCSAPLPLSFSWYDAAVLSQKIRQACKPGRTRHDRFELPLTTDQLGLDD